MTVFLHRHAALRTHCGPSTPPAMTQEPKNHKFQPPKDKIQLSRIKQARFSTIRHCYSSLLLVEVSRFASKSELQLR